MDLAASAGFVNEPAEKNIYSRPPRDPKEKFLNNKMIAGIAASGASLFLAVSAAYLYGISQHLPLIESQTMAFNAWLIGHIFLAFVSRSESEPLSSLGIFKNKIMNIWALIIFAFIIISLNIPGIENNLKLTHLNIGQISLIVLISLVAVFWQEAVKLIFFNKKT
jgi:Ca2+-transporting ATPase